MTDRDVDPQLTLLRQGVGQAQLAEEGVAVAHLSVEGWTCNGFVPVTYLIMPPWLQTRVG